MKGQKQACSSGTPVFGTRQSRGARGVRCTAQINRRAAILSGSAAVSSVALKPSEAKDIALNSKEWESVDLGVPDGVVLLDIAFTSDPSHGFLTGTKQTLLETKDGGKSWEPRSLAMIDEEGINYRFNAISFSGEEGWMVGKPAICLYTGDAGKTWKRIPLSAKLPGPPINITALQGGGSAEMATESGAIYVTNNTGETWRAAVQETVDATLNRTVSSGISGASYYEGSFATITRSSQGKYVGVSARGNFYMTWAPGDSAWTPHNRPATRRLQSLGWTLDERLWATTRGGDVLLADKTGVDANEFSNARIASRGFGMLDIGFRTEDECYACGGSGSLFKSVDGGKSYKRLKGLDKVPGNLYAVEFYGDKQGFILGNDGILLRYIGGTA